MRQIRTLIFTALTLGLIHTAASAQHQERDITIAFTSPSLQQVLTYLHDHYDLRFAYNNEQVPLDKKITLTRGTITLNRLLQTICEQTDLEYTTTGDQILLRAKPRPSTSQVQGSVTNINNQPLAYVSISLQNSPRGTLTNETGLFSIAIDTKGTPAILVVSCIGYKSQKITLSHLTQEKLEIRLQPETIQLTAIEVHAKTGLSILEEARARIQDNYDTSAVQCTLFVRELAHTDEDPISVGEAVHEAYRGVVNGSPVIRQTSLVKGRRDKDHATFQKVLSNFPRWTGFDFWADLNVIFDYDLALPREGDNFLSKKFLRQHDFELLGTSRLNDRDVYVVAFDQKDRTKNHSLYTGKIYIDLETLAFVRVESGLSPKGVKRAKFLGSSRAMAYIFGFSECRVHDLRVTTDYTPFNNKWYLHAVHIDYAFIVAKSGKALAMDINLNSDIIVTDMNVVDPHPIPQETIITPHDLRYLQYLYNDTFWNGYATLLTNHQTKEAFATIADKNRRTPFDVKFWRLFHPYKSNPALLHLIDSTTAAHRTEPENEIPSAATGNARHAPLTRTHHTPHFILAHTPEDSLTAIQMGQVLEENYSRILHDFELTTLPEQVLAEIYPTLEDYHFAIGKPAAPASDAGMATGNTTFKIVSPRKPGSYHTTASILRGAVHEFAHCVHYNYIDAQQTDTQNNLTEHLENPWLFEALASYEAGQFYNPARFTYLKEGHHPTLQELNDVDANGKIYDLGFLLIEYIIKSSGKEKLLSLIRLNGNVAQTLNKTEADFEKDFYHYIQQTYLSQ